jgi:hypothetical protein
VDIVFGMPHILMTLFLGLRLTAASIVRAESLSKTFYRRLVWRDLAYWQLFHWPDMATEPIRRHYVDQEWSSGPAAAAHLRAWQKGQTGFPLVDAGGFQTPRCRRSIPAVCAQPSCSNEPSACLHASS